MAQRLSPAILALILVAAACGSTGPSPSPAAASPSPTATPPIATPAPTLAAAPTPALELADLAQFHAAMRPEFAADVDGSPDLTRYAIDVAVTFNADGTATLAGREHVLYTNQQTVALPDIVFMLWPAAGGQYASRMDLGRVTVDGSEVRPQMENDGLTARIALPAPLAPGARAELSAEFTVKAFPWTGGSGIKRFGITGRVLLAPTFYPLIPRLVDGLWQTLPAPPGGDTTNSDSALYVWRVTAPADQVIVGSGSVVSATTTGQTQTQTIVTGPMRDLALAVGPLRLTSRTADGVTLNAYLLPEHADKASAILDVAAGQLRTLEALVGPYPFAELDLVGAGLCGGVCGIEYPGEVFINVGSAMPPLPGEEGFGPSDQEELFQLLDITVHEVGHQWFYGLIGDDQLLQPWVDEAATSYTEVLYAEKTSGAAAARDVLRKFQDQLRASSDRELPVGLGIADYPSELEYGVIVYDKGALFFDALRRQLGDPTFFAFLHAYYERYRYGFASARGFQATAETACACDLSALFDLWVYKGGAVPAN